MVGLLLLTALLCITPAARATWSVILVDTATGEIAIGTATCLPGDDLPLFVPVIRVGFGGGCEQAFVRLDGRNRQIIFEELALETRPSAILRKIQEDDDNFGFRQFGIVDMRGRQANHTGHRAEDWAGTVRGREGDLAYTVVGDLLTGESVILAARDALLNTPGDVAEKLMAAMEAAASFGGDGRCSCDPIEPDSCGSPPPDFEKSAHAACMVIARIGDRDGDCAPLVGCVDGEYYQMLNVARDDADEDDPDPVLQLRELFEEWRLYWTGRPDHLRSIKTLTEDSVPGNGTRSVDLKVTLHDWLGEPVAGPELTLSVRHHENSAGLARIGTPRHLGGGVFRVPLVAGAGQGTDVFDIVASDGEETVTLFPRAELKHTPSLRTNRDSVSAAGGVVGFSLQGPDAAPGRLALLLASFGMEPGFDIGPVHVPLNPDALLLRSYVERNGPVFIDTEQQLASDGSGRTWFAPHGDLLGPLVGQDLAFAFLTLDPIDFASNPVWIHILP